MNQRSKTFVKRIAIFAVLTLSVLRIYREFAPAEAKSTAYILASVEGGTITSPAGNEYMIQFNDAGGMHSGHHWTWVVGYSWLTGSYVKTAGYLDAEYAVDGQQIPVKWNGEQPVFPFENGRYY